MRDCCGGLWRAVKGLWRIVETRRRGQSVSLSSLRVSYSCCPTAQTIKTHQKRNIEWVRAQLPGCTAPECTKFGGGGLHVVQ